MAKSGRLELGDNILQYFILSAILYEKRPFAFVNPLWEAYGQRTMIILGSLESA